jgi:predicted dehydrogenase
MKVLRVGIIGQGRSGYGIHAHYLRTAPDKFKIVAVADLLKDRCRQAEEELACASSTDYRDLFRRSDLDFLVNSTPSHLHVPVTRDCLKAGFNVLCEKPLARRAKDVDAILALAKKQRRFFAVYQQSRFNPYFEKVREIIDSGVLGRVVMVKMASSGFGRRWDWQTIQSMNGGNLLNTGPHPVDQALVFFDPKGAMPNVLCRMDRANTFGDAEDHVKLLLWGKGKPTIDLEISSCSAYPTYSLQVYGTRGGLTHSGGKVQWRWFDPAEAPKQKLIRTPMPGRTYCSEKLPWREDQWEKPMEIGQLFDFMAARFYDNLHAALTEGKPLAVPPTQVRRQIAVMEEAHRQNPLSRLKR